MTRKILTLFMVWLCVSFFTVSFAQDDNANYQNLKFSAQPKHQSEIGVHLGHFMVVGDILPRPGWGAGIHFRRAFDYAFAWRVDAMIGRAFGLEPRNSGGSHVPANRVLNGTDNNGVDYTGRAWYHNYKTEYYSLSLQGIWSLNTFNFKKQIRKVNWYIFGGIGADFYNTFYDALDGNTQHDFSRVSDGLAPETSREDRRTARDRVRDILDGDYETRAETATGRRGDGGDEREELQLNAHADVGIGLAFKLTPKINIALEHKATVIFGNEGDLVDGYRWRTVDDLTQYRDLLNYTNVRVNFNIGKGDDTSEPLWWVSPLDLIAEDLSEVKARPVLDLTDTDEDGVIDMLDDEKDTKKDCPVDTRGIILDSDNDGIPNCEDEEPHSPPGYQIDSKGVANVPAPDILTEGDVNNLIDAKLATYVPDTKGVSDWFLPMVHFNLDKYSIRQSEYGKLHHVATVMKSNSDIRVVAVGHTDRLAGNCYNDLLSYNRANACIEYLVSKYGIARDRFILNWGGEGTTIVPTNGANLINRRVEFKVATEESDMARPDCGVKNAGSGSGSQYSGNKEAGY
ncbi:MAG: OmpA family protein [Bacteroidota bacterium]